MISPRLYWGFVCSFIAFGLVALYLHREPLCIDSKVVEKIDRYTSGFKKETVFQCRQRRPALNVHYFVENLPHLQHRIQKVEKFLEMLGPTSSKVSLAILVDKPNFFVQKNGQIWMGEKLLSAQGHLEKAILKNWIQEKWPVYFAQQELADEVMSDFLYYLMNGKLEIQDILTNRLFISEKAHWPQIIKSVRGYCDSPWRLTEHFEFCSQFKVSAATMSSEALEFGLRPLMTQAMIESYNHLSFKNRMILFRGLSDFVKMPRQPAPRLLKKEFVDQVGNDKLASINTLQEASQLIQEFNDFISHSPLVSDVGAFREFAANFGEAILVRGFRSTFRDLEFDIAVQSEMPISKKMVQHFIQIQAQNPEMSFALIDQKHVWLIPHEAPLPRHTFGQLRAHRAILEKCTSFDFKDTFELAERYQRVLVVGTCESDFKRKYGAFVKTGAEGFALQNPKTSFVQLHLPSLMIKKAELVDTRDVFNILTRRESDNPTFQLLGWQEIRWNKQMNAYTPRAHIDGIEWFRGAESAPN